MDVELQCGQGVTCALWFGHLVGSVHRRPHPALIPFLCFSPGFPGTPGSVGLVLSCLLCFFSQCFSTRHLSFPIF